MKVIGLSIFRSQTSRPGLWGNPMTLPNYF